MDEHPIFIKIQLLTIALDTPMLAHPEDSETFRNPMI